MCAAWGAPGCSAGGGLVGERLGEIGGGEVVAGLVGGGEQRVEIGVGAVGDQPLGPAAAAAAGEQGGFGGVGGGGVEAVEAGSAAALGRAAGAGAWRYGRRGEGVLACGGVSAVASGGRRGIRWTAWAPRKGQRDGWEAWGWMES